jgi:hypothetical protein
MITRRAFLASFATSPPALIVQGPAGEKRWGRYQFPTMFRMADGRILVFVHVEADSATAYGMPKRAFVSTDEGRTWREDPDAANKAYGLKLANGEWLRTDTPPALKATDLRLPPEAGSMVSYRQRFSMYRLADLEPELRRIFFQRFSGGVWKQESTELDAPGAFRYAVEGVFPRIWWGDMRVAPDRSIYAVVYPDMIEGRTRYHMSSACYRSNDNGRNWKLQGRIPYNFDPDRDGYTEPAFEILRDGSLLAVVRTTDGKGVGPMMRTRSSDHGRTWTPPEQFTSNGVLPRLLRLANGTLVLASGRPGVQLRFSRDDGRTWTDPQELVPVTEPNPQADTCGYTDLLPLGRSSFLIVYSWFKRPDGDKTVRKAILARRVST